MAKKTDNVIDVDMKNKLTAVEQAVGQIEKQHGKGSIMRLGVESLLADVPVIPTGSLSLDNALGVGGLPKGRIVEIYGPESSGKTTLALHAIANAQKQGGVAVLIDAEYAFDANYAKNLGVDIDNLLVSQPDTGEQALEIADTLVRSGAIDIIVIDSVAALVPAAEIEVRRIAAIKDGENVVGNRTKAKVVKNKVAPPFKEAEFDILYGRGISLSGDVVDLATEHNIIEKSGTWFSFEGERIGQGREKAKEFLEQNPEIMTRVEGLLREKFKIARRQGPVADNKEDKEKEA
jgi:recombination protein RecA